MRVDSDTAGYRRDKMIRTAIFGITGKMGSMVFQHLVHDDRFHLVGGVSSEHVGKNAGEVLKAEGVNAMIFGTTEELLGSCEVQLLIDFSRAGAAYSAISLALEKGIKVVSGTTGFSAEQIHALKSKAEKHSNSLLIAPNFCVGAVLMMKFARLAAPHFAGCEIIELHHTQKADSPSGTAKLTAEMISEVSDIKAYQVSNGTEFRGGDYSHIRIHSVRLPGMLAHQEVILGNPGEVLTIRHDSSDRNSFMNGIYKAIDRVMTAEGYTYGIDSLI